MIDKQEFLAQVDEVMEVDMDAAVRSLVLSLVETITEVDERNEGLADKLRACNIELTCLRAIKVSAQRLAEAADARVTNGLSWHLLAEYHRALDDLINTMRGAPDEAGRVEDLQRELVWALETLAEQADEFDHRIRLIADRFNFPVMIPVREGVFKFSEPKVKLNTEEDLWGLSVQELADRLEASADSFPDEEPVGMTAENLEKLQELSDWLPDATFNELLLAGGLFSRLMPAMEGLPDEAQVGLAILPDGHASIRVELNDIPPDWAQDWIGIRPGR